MTAPYTSVDALKYLARYVRRTVNWTVDCLAMKDLFCDEHVELDAICQMADDLGALVGPLVEAWDRYSDGRPVESSVEIAPGQTFTHLWHPDPARNQPGTVTGRVLADPGVDHGTYEVRIIPPRTLSVVLHPPRPPLSVVQP